jgi:hypothetical protein
MGEENKRVLLGDKELQAKIDEIKEADKKPKRMRKYAAILIVIWVISMLLIVMTLDEDSGISVVQFGAIIGTVVVFMLPGLFLLKKFSSNWGQTQDLIDANIIQPVLEEAFDEVSYNRNWHIKDDVIKKAGLVKKTILGKELEPWNRSRGSDLICAEYRGHPFEFSYKTLEYVTTKEDSKGNQKEEVETMFSGICLILKHDIDVAVPLRLREIGGRVQKTKSAVQTENIAFNEQFVIETEDAHTAFLILTPHFMEYIISADTKANGNTFMCFSGKEIFIGIDRSTGFGNFFKDLPGRATGFDVIREKMRAYNRDLTAFMDELMLNDYLFTKFSKFSKKS